MRLQQVWNTWALFSCEPSYKCVQPKQCNMASNKGMVFKRWSRILSKWRTSQFRLIENSLNIYFIYLRKEMCNISDELIMTHDISYFKEPRLERRFFFVHIFASSSIPWDCFTISQQAYLVANFNIYFFSLKIFIESLWNKYI